MTIAVNTSVRYDLRAGVAAAYTHGARALAPTGLAAATGAAGGAA